ncbi:Hsp104 [Emiliania huxleyi CCMP1516]|uniref:Clp ATPase C-terminal domain-containing protein n=2 Tax=Emiliania huxleyi TaxID=2903 RepID=A0A0D3KUG3_EMIH1|nr:Hsp104 [Emiliania huxleyi CCMP1516]EOD39398.1 Hsp104 [Emiliania huxleyi CCMP1516]|eukprot:XP_005791827.1 Hsp104 [Emiliania huxleyi CCMP1516]
MEATLARSVIGQDEALAVVSNAVRVSRAGLQSSERPLGAPLLAPSCWSGRPAWARRASARFLFDSADAAHREVATLLLQVLDEGRLTDSQGKTVDFRNTIIIMTSNLGAEAARVAAGGGRLLQGAARSAQGDRGRLPARVRQPARRDSEVLFERLTRERIAAICAVEVQLRERLSARGVRLRLSPDALLRLAEAGYDPAYGARPVRRAIRHHLLDPLSRLLIGDQEAQDGATVLVDTKDTGAGAGGGAAQPSIVPPLPGVPFATGLFGAGGAAAAVPPSDMAAAVRIRLLAPGAPLPPEDTGVDWDEGPESAA